MPKPLKVPSLARSVPKPLNVPSLARFVPKPLKEPSLARSVLKPFKKEQEGEGAKRHYTFYHGSPYTTEPIHQASKRKIAFSSNILSPYTKQAK